MLKLHIQTMSKVIVHQQGHNGWKNIKIYEENNPESKGNTYKILERPRKKLLWAIDEPLLQKLQMMSIASFHAIHSEFFDMKRVDAKLVSILLNFYQNSIAQELLNDWWQNMRIWGSDVKTVGQNRQDRKKHGKWQVRLTTQNDKRFFLNFIIK